MKNFVIILKVLLKNWIIVTLLLVGLIFLVKAIVVPSTPIVQEQVVKHDPLLDKYAGAYLRMVENAPVTSDNFMYILANNGSAKWMWVEVIGGMTNVKQEKTGTWFAVENAIHITINGNTGPIEQTFALVGDKFKDFDIYLIKVK